MRATHLVKLRIALAALLAFAWVGACLDDPAGLKPPPPPAGLVVSDPVVPAGAPAAPSGALSAILSNEQSVVYVSLLPGTEPRGVTATVRALQSGTTLTTAVREGGFDPVSVAAEVGDTIEVIVRDASGAVVLPARIAVARVRPPIVVRTDPPPRKRDVPLNSVMVVIFSEPIDPATLTGAAVQLFEATTSVGGRLEFRDPDHLTAELQPDAPLKSGTDYRLVVTRGIEDLDGDSLEAPMVVEFETVPPVDSVNVSPDGVSVVISDSVQLTAVVRDSAGNVLTDRPVTWASSDSAVASVSPAGLVRGTQVGSAFVVATAEGKADSAMITVTPVPVASVAVNPPLTTILVGDSVQLTAVARDGAGNELLDRPVMWTSSDSAIAMVLATGLVRGVAVGSAQIVASVESKADTAMITVTLVPVASVSVSPRLDSILVGDSVQLDAVARDIAGNVLPNRPVTWASSDSATATVSPAGLVRGVTPGSALIIASAEGKADTATIVVDQVRLVFTVEPSAATAGVLIAPAVQVEVRRSWGTDPRFAGSVTVTIGANPAGGTLGGVVTAGALGGVATFGSLWVDRPGTGYTLVATAAGVASDTSAAFDIAPANPPPPPGVSRFAFTSYRDDPTMNRAEIYVMNADGSGVQRATYTTPADRSNHGPAWSPDGTRLAFTSDRADQFANHDVFVMNADGSGLTRIVDDPVGANSPAWSPDGTRIAFASYRDGYSHIYVVNADGTGITGLTNGAAWDTDPAWSPDGTRIAFDRDPDATSEIYVMNADGSGISRLTNHPANDGDPAWSPDGTRIAFASTRDDDDGSESHIYVMNADGSGVTRLTTDPRGDGSPSWSPDGTRIAFGGGDSHLYVMNDDGSGLYRIDGGEGGASWSPVGTMPPRPALTIQKVSGDFQADTVLATLAQPLRVQVLRSGVPAAGVTVAWTVIEGTLSAPSSVTDGGGFASVMRTLGPTVRSQGAVASVTELGELRTSVVTFTATANPGNPAQLISTQFENPLGVVGTPVLWDYGVVAQDSHGNPLTGVTIDWAVTSGGGSISPTQGITPDTLWRVAWARQTLGPAEGLQTATATMSAVPGAPQVAFAPRAVTALVLVDDDYQLGVGQFVNPNVAVEVGKTVGWQWLSENLHNVTFEDDPTQPTSSPDQPAYSQLTRTFTTPGTYRYRCTLHSSSFTDGMVGAVTVVPQP
jgi:Tol biopolymer transport system component/uncharacterized protein YjdB/plastocyanin